MLSVIFRVVRCLSGLLAMLARSDLSKDAELLVLRHESQVRAATWLVELVGAIRDRGILARPDGQECVVWDMRAHLDLPVFGARMRETWNFPPPAVSAGSWANLNAFAAQLTVAGIDFSLYAIWTLREALEEDSPRVPQVLASAVEWFRHAGSVLASLAVQRAADVHGRDGVGRLCREAGLPDRGFTVGRWDFWRRRLEDISAAGGDAAERARAGLEYMHAQGLG